jgi:aryl-alcohol dehydrogenase-like predicted oxidoreductase
MLIDGRRVAGIGLGTAPIAFRGGTAEQSVATVRAALDAGVGLIDTALAYTRPGVESYAEQVVASALRGGPGERPLIATKGGHWHDGDRFPAAGGARGRQAAPRIRSAGNAGLAPGAGTQHRAPRRRQQARVDHRLGGPA